MSTWVPAVTITAATSRLATGADRSRIARQPEQFGRVPALAEHDQAADQHARGPQIESRVAAVTPPDLGQRLREGRHEHQEREADQSGDPEWHLGSDQIGGTRSQSAPHALGVAGRGLAEGDGSHDPRGQPARRRRRPQRRARARPGTAVGTWILRQVGQGRRGDERAHQPETADHQHRRGCQVPDEADPAEIGVGARLISAGGSRRAEGVADGDQPPARRSGLSAAGRRAPRAAATAGSPRRDPATAVGTAAKRSRALPLDHAGAHQQPGHQGESREARRPEAARTGAAKGSGRVGVIVCACRLVRSVRLAAT